MTGNRVLRRCVAWHIWLKHLMGSHITFEVKVIINYYITILSEYSAHDVIVLLWHIEGCLSACTSKCQWFEGHDTDVIHMSWPFKSSDPNPSRHLMGTCSDA